ncbi:MAG: hypothetical protein RL754_201 [Bacteroidota bacterium]|jgi:hypothetical protein
MPENNKTLQKYIGIGLMVGVVVGSITKNMGLWISLGLAFGAALGYQMMAREKKEK